MRNGYRIGVPEPGTYREAINTDSTFYGGANVGNVGGVVSEPIASHGRSHSILVTLPPLATLIFVRS